MSRIWGGIHPPIDDIKGRIVGQQIGIAAYNLASNYFSGTLGITEIQNRTRTEKLYRIPFTETLHFFSDYLEILNLKIFTIDDKLVLDSVTNKTAKTV